MYQIGDQVVYGMHGVCRVVDLEEKMVSGKRLTYLVLEPVGQEGSRYLIPTHNASAMGKVRKILTADELSGLFASETVREDAWIRDENLRKQTYRELISSGDRAALMKMVHTLYLHKAAQLACGRKVHLCDENFLRDAEKLLAEEIAIVLGLAPDQAKKYVKEQLK